MYVYMCICVYVYVNIYIYIYKGLYAVPYAGADIACLRKWHVLVPSGECNEPVANDSKQA